MAKLVPNATYTMNGVTIYEKIIPDGTIWTNAANAKAAGFNAGDLYKKNQKLSGNSGKGKFVTIHNTNDLNNVCDDGEQYTRATYNENMGSARVHFYVDENGAWQNLKVGSGLTPSDPEGAAEVGWHAGDGSVYDGGNMTSLSMEIIMNENSTNDSIAKDNGARIAAWLLWKHGLDINRLVSHTYWVNKSAGKTFNDVDEQSTNMIAGKKWCPTYIFNSYNHNVALQNWKEFKNLVKTYLDILNLTQPAVSMPTNSTVSKGSEDDIKHIWDYLYSIIGNAYGVAGLMGNLYAESGLRSNNMQNSYEKKLGYNDDTYTSAVDNGSYVNFINDSVGYGLAQWTFWTRKQNLFNYSKALCKSIGDVDMQISFLCKELEDGFPLVLQTLKTATSVLAASNSVLLQFERPSNQSDSMQKKRAAYGQAYYNKYAGSLDNICEENEEDDEDMTVEKFRELMRQYREELQDNDCESWSREAREWAINNGLVSGTGDGEDGQPNYAWADQLTREQAVTLFYRFAHLMGKA